MILEAEKLCIHSALLNSCRQFRPPCTDSTCVFCLTVSIVRHRRSWTTATMRILRRLQVTLPAHQPAFVRYLERPIRSVLTQSVCTHSFSLCSLNQSVLTQPVCTHSISLYSFIQSVLTQPVCTHSISLYSLNQSVLTQSVCTHSLTFATFATFATFKMVRRDQDAVRGLLLPAI